MAQSWKLLNGVLINGNKNLLLEIKRIGNKNLLIDWYRVVLIEHIFVVLDFYGLFSNILNTNWSKNMHD